MKKKLAIFINSVKTSQIIKYSIFIVFLGLFLTQSQFYAFFADKINTQILRPRNQYILLNNQPPLIQPEKTLTPTPVTKSEVTRYVTIIYITPTFPPTVSEESLIEALNSYRISHGISSLTGSETLCAYARKRVGELYDRYQKNPDNPLDAHAGFEEDAKNGYLFEATGFNQIGENLAFTPSYSTATEIIEWGWDSSEGHRNLQLSTDMTHVCLSGKHPIYVGIFAK